MNGKGEPRSQVILMLCSSSCSAPLDADSWALDAQIASDFKIQPTSDLKSQQFESLRFQLRFRLSDSNRTPPNR